MGKLDDYLEALRFRKLHEEAAVEQRRKLEDEIVAYLASEHGHEKGTLKTERHKVVVRKSESYKVDEKKWAKIAHAIPDDLQPIKTKIEADSKGCKYLAEHEPALWALCAEAIELREGRTSVSVDVLKEVSE